MSPRSLYKDLMNDTPLFQQTLLYMCRAISCNEFQKITGVNNDHRNRLIIPQYYISLRNHVFACLGKGCGWNTDIPKNVDSKHVQKALRNPMIMLPLLRQLEKQNGNIYTDTEVQKVLSDATVSMQKAAGMIARSKLRFLTIFQGMAIEDLEQDLMVKAIQTIGWSFDRRPIQETVLLGCKAMHNHAKNVADYWSAKKRQNSTARDSEGKSSVRSVHIGSFGHTGDTSENSSWTQETMMALATEDQFESIELELSYKKLTALLTKTRRRKKLLSILTADSSPDFTNWLRRHRVIKGSQTDKHLFEQDPSKYVVSGCSFVGLSPKQTTRLIRQLQGAQ